MKILKHAHILIRKNTKILRNDNWQINLAGDIDVDAIQAEDGHWVWATDRYGYQVSNTFVEILAA